MQGSRKEGFNGAAAPLFFVAVPMAYIIFLWLFYDKNILTYLILSLPPTHPNCKLKHSYLKSSSYPPDKC